MTVDPRRVFAVGTIRHVQHAWVIVAHAVFDVPLLVEVLVVCVVRMLPGTVFLDSAIDSVPPSHPRIIRVHLHVEPVDQGLTVVVLSLVDVFMVADRH